MVLRWIKKSVIALLLIIVVVIGGTMSGDIGGKKTEENKWKGLEEQLHLGLERLQKENLDLWEANEVFQKMDKLEMPDDKNIPPKVVEITSKSMAILGGIFKDFTEKVLKNEIKLSDLEAEKFNTVAEVKKAADKILLVLSKNYTPEEKQEAKVTFGLLESKIKEEQNRRVNRSKFWETYEFDKILEFRNDPDLLEKKWVDENLLTHRDVKNWLDIGIRPKEYDFVRWIREVKSQQYSTEEIGASFKDPKWLKDNVVIDDLRREFKESKNSN